MTEIQQTNDVLQTLLQMDRAEPGFAFLVGLIGLIISGFLCGAIFVSIRFISDFSEELRQLNMDIARSKDKEERRYYRGLRRRLWLSWLPFFRD